MKVTPIRTDRVVAGAGSLEAITDAWLPELPDRAVVAVASKIVSLCENRLVKSENASKLDLIARESDLYLKAPNDYGFHFTITRGTLIPAAGIDQSNVGGGYLLWPEDPQASANALRRHLDERFGHPVGVVITDSTCTPLRRGTIGVCVAHSGFRSVNDYVGTPDLFGRTLSVSSSNVAAGIAAAAVVAMGEGTEQTPLCVVDDVPFVEFQRRDPTPAELAALVIPPAEDLFAPFLGAVQWQTGGGGTSTHTETPNDSKARQ
jgi:F420-0:gamma-glutamyl ligase